MAISSKTRAVEILERYYGHIIALGKYEAYHLALKHGEIHNRMLRARLQEIDRLPRGPEKWSGVVFSDRTLWEKVGRLHHVKDASPRTRKGGGGGRPIEIWRLRPNALEPQRPPAWSGPRPRGFPDRPSKEVMKLALTEMREIFILSTLARDYAKAVETQLTLGEDVPTDEDIKAKADAIVAQAKKTGEHESEYIVLGLWLAWRTRRE